MTSAVEPSEDAATTSAHSPITSKKRAGAVRTRGKPVDQAVDNKTTRSAGLVLISSVWDRLEAPALEIFTHAIVTILSIASIYAIELFLVLVHLDGKQIPYTPITLSDWMFYLELVAANLIILVGIAKAVFALVRS